MLNPRVILAEEEFEEGLEKGETLREEDLEGLELEELETDKKQKGKKKVQEAGLTRGEIELTAIKGMDKAIVKKLKEVGIFSANDLAQETEIDELSQIIKLPAAQIKELVEAAKEKTKKKGEEK
ncbi:MAG: helix-hairpin-helix domain-containing protein [Candidatus Freyarchaeum deiterrae]